MPEARARALTDAISEVLETMCFLCPVPLGQTPPAHADQEETMTASVAFLGDGEGHLCLRCPKPLANQMAGSLMGKTTGEISLPEMEDALREVTNMTAGGLLQRIDPAGVVSLSIPCNGEDREDADPDVRVYLDAEGCVLNVALRWGFPRKEARG